MSETKNLLDYSTEFEGILHCVQNDRSFKSFSIFKRRDKSLSLQSANKKRRSSFLTLNSKLHLPIHPNLQIPIILNRHLHGIH